jgi:uncharacterized protein YjiS (DUF1127 family)
MHQNFIQQKAPERNELAALMASFTGRIQVLSHTERAPYKHTSYNVSQTANQARVEAAKKRESAKELYRQMTEHARSLADIGLSSLAAARVMRERWRGQAAITMPVLEQIAAKGGFAFVDKGKK